MSEQKYKETKQKLLEELDYCINTNKPHFIIKSILEDLEYLKLLAPSTHQLEIPLST